MISTLLSNLYAFAMSMPTNIIILLIICLIMKVIGYKVRDCVKIIIGYLLIGLLLGIFGIHMPSFLAIGQWIVSFLKSLW